MAMNFMYRVSKIERLVQTFKEKVPEYLLLTCRIPWERNLTIIITLELHRAIHQQQADSTGFTWSGWSLCASRTFFTGHIRGYTLRIILFKPGRA